MTDWNPLDPDAASVHYDLAEWSFDQRAEVAATFADEGIPHTWDGDEVVVPEELESRVDELFAELEERLGIDAEAPAELTFDEAGGITEYDLSELAPGDRAVLSAALVDARLPHRWSGATLEVPTAVEDAVEEIMDRVDAGDVTVLDESESEAESRTVGLAELFGLADRLRRDPLDADGLRMLVDALDEIEPDRPPYGTQLALWRQAYDLADRLADFLAGGDEPDELAAIATAEQLHQLLADQV